MARVRVTTENIKAKLTLWVQGNNLTDELIYLNGSIDEPEWLKQAWGLGGLVITVEQDSLSPSLYKKIVYKEKLPLT